MAFCNLSQKSNILSLTVVYGGSDGGTCIGVINASCDGGQGRQSILKSGGQAAK